MAAALKDVCKAIQQHWKIETRLDEQFLDPQIICPNRFIAVGMTGQQYHRKISPSQIAPHDLNQARPVHRRHHYIEYYRIDLAIAHDRQCFGSVRSAANHIPGLFKIPGDQMSEILIIINNENRCHHSDRRSPSMVQVKMLSRKWQKYIGGIRK
ncbi:MAG TPA: hypothetical protein VIM11_01815 [Tepidisphaeraceae bacterium]